MQEGTKKNLIIVLGLLGLVIASLTGLAEHVSWLQLLCGRFSGSCRETAALSLFRVPLWAWGAVYYAFLTFCAFRAGKWLEWVIPSGVGVEIALLWVMISLKVVCVYCLGNLLVIVLLVILTFEKSRFWQTASLAMFFFLVSFFLIPQQNELQASSPVPVPVPAAASAEHKNALAAKVGDKLITEEELKAAVGPKVRELEQELYQVKRQRLDQLIIERLLQQEAALHNMNLEQFVNTEIISKVQPVTDADIDGYMKENKSRLGDWKGTQEELKERIRTFLQRQKNSESVIQYAKSLEPKYGVEIYLKEPESITAKVNTEGSPSTGPADAPVTVFEFSDYQCPACRAGHQTVRQIRELYKGKIRWIFKNFPLKMHQYAEKAAEAALCASDQNKFWDYQDALYSSTVDLTPENLEQFAVKLGLQPAPFKACLDSGKYKAKVEQDIQDAKNAGVDRTPTFIINGKLHAGAPPLDQFRALIDEEIRMAKEKM